MFEDNLFDKQDMKTKARIQTPNTTQLLDSASGMRLVVAVNMGGSI